MLEAIEVQRAKGGVPKGTRHAAVLRNFEGSSLRNSLGNKNVTISEITEQKNYHNK